jgi:hypothetical protein
LLTNIPEPGTLNSLGMVITRIMPIDLHRQDYNRQNQQQMSCKTITTTTRCFGRILVSRWFMISFLLTTVISINSVQSSSSSISISTAGSRCGSSTGSLPRSPSIPRSHKSRRYYHHSDGSSSSTIQTQSDDEQHQQQIHSSLSSSSTFVPPWNPSNLINSTTGLLKDLYVRIPGDWEKEILLRRTKNTEIIPYYNTICEIRQVPGDGNCLFHSISVSLSYLINRTHYDLSTTGPITTNVNDDDNDDNNDDIISGGSRNHRQQQAGRTKRRRRKYQPNIDDLYIHSQLLRDQCVQFLRNKPYSKLYLQGYESIKCYELINAAAQQYNISTTEYCQIMSEDSVWGGGPEIVVLCNILQRPIHVYELISSTTVSSPSNNINNNNNNNNHEYYDETNKIQQHSTSSKMSTSNGWTSSLLSHHHQYQQHQQQHPQQPTFVLRRMACFGSPKFDHKDAIHILSADSRFPDLRPGQQLSAGNHFLAIFPKRPNQNNDDDDDDDDDINRSFLHRRINHQRKRIRGGDSTTTTTASSSSSSSSISTSSWHDYDDEHDLPTLLLKPIHILHRTLTHYIDWLSGIVQDWFM